MKELAVSYFVDMTAQHLLKIRLNIFQGLDFEDELRRVCRRGFCVFRIRNCR